MDDLRERLNDLLARHTTATLATCGPDGPWAAAVFYAHDDDLSLYFLTDPATRHGSDLVHGGQAAATIHQDGQDWRSIQGIQLVGTAELVTGALPHGRAWRLYLAKFPFVGQFLKAPGEFLEAYAGRHGQGPVLPAEAGAGLDHRQPEALWQARCHRSGPGRRAPARCLMKQRPSRAAAGRSGRGAGLLTSRAEPGIITRNSLELIARNAGNAPVAAPIVASVRGCGCVQGSCSPRGAAALFR